MTTYGKNKWADLKAHYSRNERAILEAGRCEWGIDPYAWDEGKGMLHLTPIEAAFWADVRQADAVMYPQYPACGFFLDFANPSVKVAVECDGADFHRDKARDLQRDSVLRRNGWTVYRLTGKECNEEFNEETRETSTPAKLVQLLIRRHGIGRSPYRHPEDC